MKKIFTTIITLVFTAFSLVAFAGCMEDDSYELFGDLGSATEMEGNTVVVSIFASDDNGIWDFDNDHDYMLAANMLNYLGIACDWLEDQVAEYGCDANFIYDWNKHEDLRYDCNLDADLMSEKQSDMSIWRLIDDKIDSEALLDEYDADNIIYMAFIKTPRLCKTPSCTRNYYKGMPYPYEVCFIYTYCDKEEETPAGMAHEMLHTFGAPDLYTADKDGENYGVSEEFVEYNEKSNCNDIMFDTYDPYTAMPVYNDIMNDFTELDAYYTGLTDYSETAEKWGLDPSQHERD